MKTHLEEEIKVLKQEIADMWVLVESQLRKSKDALINHNQDLARTVVATEKRVNAYELSIDKRCENILALYSPVAVDLRFVLATLKINSNLERIADFAEGIAYFVLEIDNKFDKNLISLTRVLEMFSEGEHMIKDLAKAFDKEDPQLANKIFLRDETLDEINELAVETLSKYIKEKPDNGIYALQMLSIIRKLERVGDQAKNIAEEIIFYVEAKVLKHLKKDN